MFLSVQTLRKEKFYFISFTRMKTQSFHCLELSSGIKHKGWLFEEKKPMLYQILHMILTVKD